MLGCGEPPRLGQRTDRPTHRLVRDLDEPIHDLVDLHLLLLLFINLLRKRFERTPGGVNVQSFILVLSEYLWEIVRDKSAEKKVGVRHCERTALPVRISVRTFAELRMGGPKHTYNKRDRAPHQRSLDQRGRDQS
jgi:hypothetical protein